ncbi:MAG: hypothetical protein UY05_C0034G0009 [Candidatus Peregrinibacteria bacterium GW2011_GWA2_47_7]|nr:MAG: hypothetical protein UY05_C0034G0009 [Candidatus Peregrinibacteria bacterium GW2011_GWA2_47_7]
MISKSLRIGPPRWAVEYIMKKGRRIYGRLLSLKIVPRKGALTLNGGPVPTSFGIGRHHRFCVVVSKKTFPHAVDRNKTRRRTYAAIEYALKLHHTPKTCYDIAVVCSAAARDVAFSALRSEVVDHIKKLSL